MSDSGGWTGECSHGNLKGKCKDCTIELLKKSFIRAISFLPEFVKYEKHFIDVDQAAGSTYELHLRGWIKETLVAVGEDPSRFE